MMSENQDKEIGYERTLFPPKLTSNEQIVLKQLTETGKATGYALSKMDKTLDNATARDVLLTLEKKNLVGLVNEESAPRKKLYYDITLTGLIAFFSVKENWLNKDAISNVAHNHPNLIPAIFGNWTYFVSAGLRNEVIESLRKLFGNADVAQMLYLVASGLVLPPTTNNEAQMDRLGEYSIIEQITKRVLFEGFDPQTEKIGELAVNHLITRHVLFLGLDPRFYNLYEYKINGKAKIDPELLKWLPVLAGNDILKEYSLAYLDECHDYFTERLEHVKLWNFLIRAASRSKRKQRVRKPLSPEEEKMLYAIRSRLFKNSN